MNKESLEKLVEAATRAGYIEALIAAEKMIEHCTNVRSAQVVIAEAMIRKVKKEDKNDLR